MSRARLPEVYKNTIFHQSLDRAHVAIEYASPVWNPTHGHNDVALLANVDKFVIMMATRSWDEKLQPLLYTTNNPFLEGQKDTGKPLCTV